MTARASDPPVPEHAPDDPGERLARILSEQGFAQAPQGDTPDSTDPGHRPDPLLDPFAGPAQDRSSEDRAGRPARDAAASDGSGGERGGTGQGDAADRSLPDTPLFRLLTTIEVDIGVEDIDRVWLFPPRRLLTGETAIVVVAAFTEPGSERRRVLAAHYTAPKEGPAPRIRLDEYGSAPAERLGRMVEEVVERLKEQPGSSPRTVRIDGETTRWNRMLHELAEHHLEETLAEDRRRKP